MRLARILLAALLVPLVGARAQEVTAPFVSRLHARAQGTAVVLTWQDSPDVRGPLAVYRSTEEITAETFAKAQKVAEVPYGTGSYADHPSDTRAYFYAVLARDAGGRRYDVFVAFRNKTVTPCAIEDVGGPEQVAAHIEDIRAQASSTGIRVSFTTDRPSRTLVLYRNTTPIAGLADLPGAVAVILEPGTTFYQDAPPAGIGFYYAVADEELAKISKVRFVAGSNATTAAASVPLSAAGAAAAAAAMRESRTRPLPFVAVRRGVYSGEEIGSAQPLPERKALGPEAEEAVSALLAGLPPTRPAAMKPVVLDVDRTVSGGGEESILQSIALGAFQNGDRSAAEKQLRDFLSVRRSADLKARGRFYLGQVLYFGQRTREALFELLPVLDVYYVEAWPWVDRCLDELAGTQ